MEAAIHHEIPHSFEVVREVLDSIDVVDGVTAGLSPVTVRWLTKKNTYINVGLEELGAKSCKVMKNNNSFGVKDSEVEEVFSGIVDALKKKEHLDA
jgi:hypothetical protein